MSIEIFKHSDRPDEFAVSKAGASTVGSVFFLDFSRPIKVHRWMGVHNKWIGIAVGLLVPVIHEGDDEGGYVISVERSDPYFKAVRSLWSRWHPSARRVPAVGADGLKIMADFANHFRDDC